MIRELRKRLQDELKALEHELRNELPQEIKLALAMGDLRENAEYHSALERQSYVKARMGQLSKRLAELGSFNLGSIPKDRVGLGSKVTLNDLDSGAEIVYTLVMNDDGDIALGRISIGSPIGRGLVGKRVGDEVTIQIPAGTKKFEIVDLWTIHDEDEANAAKGEKAESGEPDAGDPDSARAAAEAKEEGASAEDDPDPRQES